MSIIVTAKNHFAEYLLSEELKRKGYQVQIQEAKKLDDYDTIMAVLDGKIRTEGKHSEGKQEVQQDLLVDEGNYRLFYITIYNPNPEYSDVEAYVLFDKKSKDVSYYDHNSHNINVDGKHVGKTNNTELLDKVVDEFKMESKSAAHKGATEAYYNVLKEM